MGHSAEAYDTAVETIAMDLCQQAEVGGFGVGGPNIAIAKAVNIAFRIDRQEFDGLFATLTLACSPHVEQATRESDETDQVLGWHIFAGREFGIARRAYFLDVREAVHRIVASGQEIA